MSNNEIAYENYVLDIYKLWEQVEGAIARGSFDKGLNHLVKLRASQINGCGFCVKMHTSEARRDGESDKRLDHLVVWRQVDDFSAAEKAAFAWTEALTVLDPNTSYEKLRGDLLQHYSEKDISLLTSVVSMINLWNRFAISRH
jgi:AhpD family alkylhydroperoxidase